jgi:hypothetical protein
MHLLAMQGTWLSVEILHELSGARVWRVRWTEHSVIVKASSKQHEVQFYQHVAPFLRAQGIPLPQLELSTRLLDTSWMVIEDIPLPLPRTRWLAGPEQIAVLRQLHQCSDTFVADVPSAFVPQWTDHMTSAALTWFSPAIAELLRPILNSFQTHAQELFVRQCLISGDPNPINWGLRRDGSVVLFDWERFSWGTPAIDLAITIPGFGDRPAFHNVAACYLGTKDHVNVAQLSNSVALAKVWSIVEFLNMFPIENGTTPTIAYMQQEFPSWLHELASTPM